MTLSEGESTRKRKNTTGIPDYAIDGLARALLPAIRRYFETEEAKSEFELWKAERQKLQLNKKSENMNNPIISNGLPFDWST